MSSKIVQMEMPLTCDKLPESSEEALKKYLRNIFGGDFRALFALEGQQNKAIKTIDTRIEEVENVLQYLKNRVDNLCESAIGN